MPLKVKHDGEADGEVQENCCICFLPTHFWHHTDVALCPDCAKTTKLSDLPSKALWCEQENRRATAKKNLIKNYLPKSVSLGMPLTVAGLAAIVHQVKSGMQSSGYTHVVVKESQTMMQSELRELERLLKLK